MRSQRIVRPDTAFSVASTKQRRKVAPEPALLTSEVREWRRLNEFPDYEISNDGRLRRCTAGSNMKAGVLIRVTFSKGGYPKYGLTSPDGKRHYRNAHSLVADEFLDPMPLPGMLVLHDDDNRLNCRDTNLKWGTGAQNVADAKRNGLWEEGDQHSSARKPWTRPRGEGHSASKLTDEKVRSILADHRTGPAIAYDHGVDSAVIYRIKRGLIWKHITNPDWQEKTNERMRDASLRQRRPREKDEKHLRFIRSLPCCICGAAGSDPAHIRSASLIHGKSSTGMAEKPSDSWVTPLCRAHHDEQHKAGDELKWWASKGVDPFGLALALHHASGDEEIAEGILRSHMLASKEK